MTQQDATDDDTKAFPWELLTPAHAAAVRQAITSREAKPSTQNRELAAIRGVTHSCWQLGLVDTDTRERIKDALKGIKASSDRLAGRYVEWSERALLFETVSRDESRPRGARDAAVLALLCVGLRRSEVAGLNMSDFTADGGELVVRGKGNKTRTVFVDNGALEALIGWLEVRGDSRGALLLPVTRDGTKTIHFKRARNADRRTPARLDVSTIHAIVQRVVEAAGVPKLTPHDLRRTVTSDLLDQQRDVVAVQQHLGHSSPAVTSRYDRRGERRQRATGSAIKVPFIGDEG